MRDTTDDPKLQSDSAAESVRAPEDAKQARSGSENQNESEVNEETAESESIDLDLVLNVELNLTLRFGQRQLTLREVLDLSSGSVVELDRQVEEPVELLLDDKVVARGEAVVIDGNYGLRVSEVPHPVSRSAATMLAHCASH